MVNVVTDVYNALSQMLVMYAQQGMEALITVIVLGLFVIIGYLVAKVVNFVLLQLIEKGKVEEWIKKKKIDRLLAGYKLGDIVTMLLLIYVPLLFLGQALTIRNLGYLGSIVTWIIWYVPNLIIGVAVLIVALYFAEYVSKILVKQSKMQVAGIVGKLVQVFIAYMAVVVALPKILPGVDVTIIHEAFRWLVIATSIAFGLGTAISIGWGFKDAFASAAKKNQKVFDNLFRENK